MLPRLSTPEVMFRSSVRLFPLLSTSCARAVSGVVCRMTSCSPSYSPDDRRACRAARGTESEPAHHVAAPLFESPLKRAQLSVRKRARMLALQPLVIYVLVY